MSMRRKLMGLLLTFAAAYAVGAAAGARAQGQAETTVAAFQPSDTREASQSTNEEALRAALWSEARHLGGSFREAVAAAIVRAEREHGIPALLILAIIKQESGFDPAAQSLYGALGLMQLRPFVARDYAARRGIAWRGDRTLLDPARNIQLATGYLGELLARFGSLDLALAAYNKGPEHVKRQLRAGPEGPTPEFVQTVLARYDHYNARFAGF
jgi:soluble lytic murein transglycosylase-like protein